MSGIGFILLTFRFVYSEISLSLYGDFAVVHMIVSALETTHIYYN